MKEKLENGINGKFVDIINAIYKALNTSLLYKNKTGCK